MNALHRINWIARLGLAFMFAYHGLVPKILWLSDGERALIEAHGIEQVQWLAYGFGAAEIVLAIWILLAKRSGWPLLIAALGLIGLLVDVAIVTPSLLGAAFNPVTLNLAGLTLCLIAWISRPPKNRSMFH